MKQCWCGNKQLVEYSQNYWKCENCQSLVSKVDISYDSDNVCDNSDFYGKDYWEQKMVTAAEKKNLDEVVDLYLRERAIYWIKTLLQYVLPGTKKIAETGCGLGQFSYLLKLAGYQQVAYELSPKICEYIKNTLNINILCGGMKECLNEFDAITAFDVLEHFTDPEEFLKIASSSLKDDGILLLQTPVYDAELNYASMLQNKPRFDEQLKQDEHVFLFSKESLQVLLNRCGFSYVKFLDAYFGNDYDMFFVASKKPIHINTPEEIEESLNRQEAGRLIKALITLEKEHRDLTEECALLRQQQSAFLDQIVTLTEKLTVSENDRAARLEQIKSLGSQLNQVEADYKSWLGQINQLTKQLKESEEDREARLVQINQLTKQLKESEEDREARLVQINQLTKQLKESEEDRASRLEQILTLSDMVKRLQEQK